MGRLAPVTEPDDFFIPCGPLPFPGQAFFMYYDPIWDLVRDINAANELRGTATFDFQIEMTHACHAIGRAQ